MFQLVYASTAVKTFSTEELLALLHQSREWNSEHGITGFFLYKDGSFMQALEGEKSAVHELFATISKDPRHHHILTLVAIQVPKRQFPDWSMGFQNLDEDEPQGIPSYKSASRLPVPPDNLPWKESIAVRLLATFMKEN